MRSFILVAVSFASCTNNRTDPKSFASAEPHTQASTSSADAEIQLILLSDTNPMLDISWAENLCFFEEDHTQDFTTLRDQFRHPSGNGSWHLIYLGIKTERGSKPHGVSCMIKQESCSQCVDITHCCDMGPMK